MSTSCSANEVAKIQRERFVMMTLRLILIATLMGLTSAVANAFEQTQIGGGAPASTAPPASLSAPAPMLKQKALPGDAAGLEFSVPAQDSKKGGTEIRLPMIGVIGKLPKLDFGLELLYGADKDKAIEEDRILPDNDLTIRGSVKHRF